MEKKEIFAILYNKETWEEYAKFKEIENNIDRNNELYKYIDEIFIMLNAEKEYIRVRGFRLICKLSKYDEKNIINQSIDTLLQILDNLKPTSLRQCLASLQYLLKYKSELKTQIISKIKMTNITKYKESMSPLIKKDIDNLIKENDIVASKK